LLLKLNLERRTMKHLQILDRVKGIKRMRDFLILQALAEGEKQVDVAQKFKLHKSVISRIAKRNSELLDELTFKEELSAKAGRLRIAFKEIKSKVGESKKDLLDWLDYVRKEMEGDKGMVITNQIINKKDGEMFTGEDREFQEKIRQDLIKYLGR